MNRWSFWAGLLSSTLVTGCPGAGTNSNNATPDAGTPQCQAEQATAIPVIHVTWQAQVLKSSTGEVAGTLTAGSVSGAQAFHSINEKGLPAKPHKLGDSLDFGVLTLSNATITADDNAALHGWYAKILDTALKCDDDVQDTSDCDPDALWEQAALGKDVTLSAIADGGQVLATWQLSNAYVTEVAGPADGTTLATVRLVPESVTFSSKALGSLPGSFPAYDVKLPASVASYDDPTVTAFMGQYLSPLEWLAQLNSTSVGKAFYAEAASQRCEGEAAKNDPACPTVSAKQHAGDYLPAHNFQLELDGTVVGGFKDVAGLDTQLEVVPYRDPEDMTTRHRPGKVKYSNIVLRVGQGATPDLLEWYHSTVQGTVRRRNGAIIAVDYNGREIMRYELTNALVDFWRSSEREPVDGGFTADELHLDVESIKPPADSTQSAASGN